MLVLIPTHTSASKFMVAIAEPKITEDNLQSSPRTSNPWRLIGRFTTIESAEAVIAELQKSGVRPSLSMVDGLSVVVKNNG